MWWQSQNIEKLSVAIHSIIIHRDSPYYSAYIFLLSFNKEGRDKIYMNFMLIVIIVYMNFLLGFCVQSLLLNWNLSSLLTVWQGWSPLMLLDHILWSAGQMEFSQ